MPKVRGLTTEQKVYNQSEKLARKCDVLLYENKIAKTRVAEYLGLTPQAVCKQFKIGHITTEVLIAVVTMTGTDGDTLKNLLTID